jgi:hypothetical protein
MIHDILSLLPLALLNEPMAHAEKGKKAVEMEQPEQARHLGLSSARVLVGSVPWG